MIRKLRVPRRAMTHPGVLGVAGFVAGSVLIGGLVDRWLYHWSIDFGQRTEQSLRELCLLFRSLGSLPTWLAIAAAFALFDGKRSGGALRRRLARAELVLWSVLSAGLVANVLKEIVRRERPRSTDGTYVFHRPWGEIVSGPGFGMPSGDASVCFAGVFALCRLVPAGWPVWLVLGCGCAFYRMVLGAHFLSDVLVGAAVGWVGVELARRACRGLNAFGAAREAGGARRPGLAQVAATAAAFVASLALWSAVEGWRPAAAEDIPGLYTTLEPSRRNVTLFLEPDGTYRSVETFTRGAPRLETREGTWSFDDALLRLDGSDPVTLLASGTQLRFGDHPGALTVRRSSGRRPQERGAGDPDPSGTEGAPRARVVGVGDPPARTGILGSTGGTDSGRVAPEVELDAPAGPGAAGAGGAKPAGVAFAEAPRRSPASGASDPVVARPPAASGD